MYFNIHFPIGRYQTHTYSARRSAGGSLQSGAGPGGARQPRQGRSAAGDGRSDLLAAWAPFPSAGGAACGGVPGSGARAAARLTRVPQGLFSGAALAGDPAVPSGGCSGPGGWKTGR